MPAPILLTALFAALTLWSLQPGQTDLLLLSLPGLLAALLLLGRAILRNNRPPPNWVVIDGSNVLHWADGKPDIATLQAVVKRLTGLGFTPGVVFDANAGYKISDRYLHDGSLARLLGLSDDRVMVANKGTPADPILLSAARDLGARVVSNDRFRDWVETHPEITRPGHLIRGGFRNGSLWLDIDKPEAD
jgi:hypothetical protein